MLVDKYLNWNEVLSYNCRHNFVVGDRGVGKTYGLTRWLLNICITEHKKFIWTRNTQAVLEELVKFNGRGFLADHPAQLGLQDNLFSLTKNTLFYGEQVIGVFNSLGEFFKVKGVNYDDFEFFIFDEFMPEVRETIRVDYDYALQSIMQSIFRKRVNFKAFYLANVLKTSSNILDFFKFEITPYFPGQVIQRNRKLNAIIFYLQNKDRAVKLGDDEEQGDAFAMANKYTESSLILNYRSSVDKNCNTNIKKKEVMMYLTSDKNYFLLREYGEKIAVMAVKGYDPTRGIPLYALNKKYVHSGAIFDLKVRNQLLSLWNSSLFVFRNEYVLTQFINALFIQ